MKTLNFSKAQPVPPTPTTPITLPKKELALLESKRLAKIHLQETDWYIVRFIEIGEQVPAEVTASRAKARVTLNK